MIEWLQYFIFVAFGVCIALVDFRIQKIPNIFLLLLLITLIGIDILFFPKTVLYKFLTGIGAFGLFYAVYSLKGGLGYGDVKYAGVIGYYLGPERVITGLLCAVILGLMYWFICSLKFRWNKSTRIAFGPWLGCGTAVSILLHNI